MVYRCRQPSLDRVVAIKVLNTDSGDVDLESFEREQRAMGRVSGHPNIVPVLHSGLTFTGRPFIVMPYLGRNTLSAWIKQHGPLAVGEALTVGVRLVGALETAHRAPDGVTQPRGKLACVRNGRVGGSSARAARIRVVGRSATD